MLAYSVNDDVSLDTDAQLLLREWCGSSAITIAFLLDFLMINSQNSRQVTPHLFWQVTQIVGGPCPVVPQDIIFWYLPYLAVCAAGTLTSDLQTSHMDIPQLYTFPDTILLQVCGVHECGRHYCFLSKKLNTQRRWGEQTTTAIHSPKHK